MKYPFAGNDKANKEEEDRCVAIFEDMIKQKRAENKDIGAVIIEPITNFENKMATPVFYKRVRAICSREAIPFIVDETRTGFGQTGKMWAHDYWYLNETDGGCPDIVTFGGKTGVSGFYSTIDYRMNP
jgi:4-aminobutyrate aminotransferase/(S)-3-amino-2-methylpropionate transaminase